VVVDCGGGGCREIGFGGGSFVDGDHHHHHQQQQQQQQQCSSQALLRLCSLGELLDLPQKTSYQLKLYIGPSWISYWLLHRLQYHL
jgi:hypothetical protein